MIDSGRATQDNGSRDPVNQEDSQLTYWLVNVHQNEDARCVGLLSLSDGLTGLFGEVGSWVPQEDASDEELSRRSMAGGARRRGAPDDGGLPARTPALLANARTPSAAYSAQKNTSFQGNRNVIYRIWTSIHRTQFFFLVVATGI